MNKDSQHIMGIYSYVDLLVDSVKKLRSSGFEEIRVFSPAPNHEIEDCLDTGKEPSKVKYFTFCGAILGALVGLAFTIFTSFSNVSPIIFFFDNNESGILTMIIFPI